MVFYEVLCVPLKPLVGCLLMIKFNHLYNALKANDSFACIYVFFYLKYVNVIKIALIGGGKKGAGTKNEKSESIEPLCITQEEWSVVAYDLCEISQVDANPRPPFVLQWLLDCTQALYLVYKATWLLWDFGNLTKILKLTIRNRLKGQTHTPCKNVS